MFDAFGQCGQCYCKKPCKISAVTLTYHVPPMIMLNAHWKADGDCTDVAVEFWTCTWQQQANYIMYGSIFAPLGSPPADAWKPGNMSSAYPEQGSIQFPGPFSASPSGSPPLLVVARVKANSCIDEIVQPIEPVSSGTGILHFKYNDQNNQVEVLVANGAISED